MVKFPVMSDSDLQQSQSTNCRCRFLSRRLGYWCFVILVVIWSRLPTLTVILIPTGSVIPKSQLIKEDGTSAADHASNPNNDDNTYSNAKSIVKDQEMPSATTVTSVPVLQDPSLFTPFDDNHRHQRLRRLGDPNSTLRLIQAVGGPHFLTPLSGCRMARWILPIPADDLRPFRRDCYQEVQLAFKITTAPRILSHQTIHLLQANDTIYMTYDQSRDFVTDLLPWIQVEVILISGQASYLTAPLQSTIDQIVENKWILQWFCQNLPKYGGSNPYHSKFASFPFGIKQRANDDPFLPTNGLACKTVFYQSLHAAMAFDNSIGTSIAVPFKNQTIFAGYVTVQSNLQYRSQVPTTDQFLPPLEYYQTMARSYYILSPNGDRPECYRHYEALGLGTAPITQLPPHGRLFQHFEGSGLIYDLGMSWDLEQLQQQFAANVPVVHRNLVLEEYWMDYVDWYVGRELTWWDRYGQGAPAKVAAILKDFLK